MSRPKGKVDYARRLRAFELYASGVKKAAVAAELGVTRQCVHVWAKEDRWDERLYNAVAKAEEAVDFALENAVGDALAELKRKMRQRVAELDALCGPASKPETRLRAIQAWLRLAGIERAMPNPIHPTTAKGLELIDDLTTNDNIRELDLVGNS